MAKKCVKTRLETLQLTTNLVLYHSTCTSTASSIISPNPVNCQQFICSKVSQGTKALYDVRHLGTLRSVIAETEQLTDDSEEKEGHMY